MRMGVTGVPISFATQQTEGVLALLMEQVFPQRQLFFPRSGAIFPQACRPGSSAADKSVEMVSPPLKCLTHPAGQFNPNARLSQEAVEVRPAQGFAD